jgi:polyamine oxidase
MKKLIGAGMLAGCVPEWRAELDVDVIGRPGSVIVVGAGAAGLAAAAVLARDGRSVTLIEARDRIGGRLSTVTVGGVELDAGAAWIHGHRDNPVAGLLEAAGHDWEDDQSMVGDLKLRLSSGRAADDGDVRRAFSRFSSAMNQQDDARAALGGSDLSVSEVLSWYLRDQGVTGEARSVARFVGERIITELDWAAPADDLSARAGWNMPDFPGGDQVPIGGYQNLTELLAEGLDVRLSEPVYAIDWSGDTVYVETDDDTYAASHVIVTVPLGVLKAGHITFTPPLPDERLALMEGTGMAALEKVILRFDDAFWGGAGDIWAVMDEEGRAPTCQDFTPHTGAPTLVCFSGGAWSLEARTMLTDEALLAATLENLAAAMGRESMPAPSDYAVTRWASDPFALGSYSYPRVGTTLTGMRELGDPLGDRLLFAGEHTAGPFHQTVHGAVLSGLREAARLGANPYALPGLWAD